MSDPYAPEFHPSPAMSDPSATETGGWAGRNPSLTVIEPCQRAMKTTSLMVEGFSFK
jgi:hypothetical protein